MDDFTKTAKLSHGSLGLPALVIVERQVLMRTLIVSTFKREFAGFEVIDMATTNDLDRTAGRDVRLVMLDVGDKLVADPAVDYDLTLLAESFPQAAIALLSDRDDEETASEAMRWGVRGFFPTSTPLEIAIAGVRLILAGAVYRPLTIDTRQCVLPRLDITKADSDRRETAEIHGNILVAENAAAKGAIDLTPREQNVVAALKLGLPNKLIAAKLQLSENTVKMHIQRIMRKCSARNRTEAVLFWMRNLSEEQ
jgi:DNA-binding NarL/FixJ family response regulator